jgi:hypothetical protein
MAKIKYWVLSGVSSVALAVILFLSATEIGNVLNVGAERMLAYTLMLLGLTALYFGFVRPHWFAKEIIPPARAVKMKVEKPISKKPSFKDDSYFWRVFPYGLFFSFGGLAYLLQPSYQSLLVALGCTAWVKLLFRYV